MKQVSPESRIEVKTQMEKLSSISKRLKAIQKKLGEIEDER